MSNDFDIDTIPINLIMNSVSQALLIIDKTGKLLYFNTAAKQMFNSNSQELLESQLADWLPDSDSFCIKTVLGNLENPLTSRYETVINQADGTRVYITIRIRLLTADLTKTYLLEIADITAEKQAQIQKIADTHYLFGVMETILDGIITINSKGLIQSFNKAAETLFQYTADEVIGKNIDILMPQPYRAEHNQYLTNYLTTGVKKIIGIGRKVNAQRKDGSVFPIELSVNSMDINNEIVFVGSIRDITESVLMEQSMHSIIANLKRSNQELEEFAYIASHDLKEPLRGLSTNASFLAEDYEDILDEQAKKRIDRMKYLCHRLEALIDDLLYFSRLGRQHLAIQKTDLNEVIRDITLTLVTDLEDNIRIITPKPLASVICDATRITEVFRNLISNGLKYNDKALKTIEVGQIERVKPNSQISQLVFYVKDNGIGIDQAFFHDIFRIFKRLNSENDQTKGTGVGLTFVKKIIERHGGKIWLESQLGVGSIFYFTLNQEDTAS